MYRQMMRKQWVVPFNYEVIDETGMTHLALKEGDLFMWLGTRLHQSNIYLARADIPSALPKNEAKHCADYQKESMTMIVGTARLFGWRKVPPTLEYIIRIWLLHRRDIVRDNLHRIITTNTDDCSIGTLAARNDSANMLTNVIQPAVRRNLLPSDYLFDMASLDIFLSPAQAKELLGLLE